MKNTLYEYDCDIEVYFSYKGTEPFTEWEVKLEELEEHLRKFGSVLHTRIKKKTRPVR